MDALDLANYIVTKVSNVDTSIDPLRLQTLLYYIQGYMLSEYNFPAFEDDIEHWKFSPVVPEVFNYYNGDDLNMPEIGITINEPALPIVTVCDCVLNSTNQYTSEELSEMTRDEGPWKNTAAFEVIDKETVKDFFKEKNPLNLTSNDFKLDESEYKNFQTTF